MKHGKHRMIRDLDISVARDLNLALASWALLSAFLWTHSEPQFVVTILLGAVVALVAPFEVGSSLVRRIIMGAGAALVLAAVALPRTSTLTLWHNVGVGLALVVLSFFGPPHGIMPPVVPAPDDAYNAGV
jgi:hypothetical protein